MPGIDPAHRQRYAEPGEHVLAGERIVEVLTAGKRLHFEPGMEHCIIGTENLLVFERSTDPKGMDQDLIFIYLPEAE